MMMSFQRLLVLIMCVRGAFGALPTFTIPDQSGTGDATKIFLSELATGGDKVITLVASDADGDTLTFTMDSSVMDTTDVFEIPSGSSDLMVKASVQAGTFDFDSQGALTEYPIVLSVNDGTNDVPFETTISIINENDEKPTFQGTEPFTAAVLESSTQGTSVYHVTATDPDGGSITYSSAGASEFQINAGTGVITVSAGTAFDQAATPEYSVTVTATDDGDPQQASATVITFTIETKPRFVNLAVGTTANVDENVGAGTSVYDIVVSDKDSLDSPLVVTIKSQSPNDMFELSDNRLVTKTGTLNADAQRTYTLRFDVTDGKYVTESALLTVSVNDLNDNIPVIEPTSPVTIPENHAIGATSEVTDINASDGDASSPNNALVHTITSGNTDGIFGIDQSTGKIYLTQAPKSMTVSQYILNVRVTDGGTPAESANVAVTITFDPDIVDECLPNTCLNGATCTSYVNDFRCTCAPGFTGVNCQTNINDCTITSCKNGGTCVDGVNSFSCTCTPGYIGVTCVQACTNNKYGNLCSLNCNCDATKLIANVGNQQCNHVTGACLCNSQWTGSKCNTDVDECTDANICTAITNQVCENTLGGYYCTCKQGYRTKGDNTCEIDPTTETLSAGVNELKVTAAMTLNKPCDPIEIQIPSKYAALKAALETMIQAQVSPAKRVLVTNIRCGSVLFDTTIIISDTDAEKARLASDLQSLRNGETVTVDGTSTKATAMTVNGNNLGVTSGSANTGTKVCQVFTSYVTCPTGETCQYVGSTASCRTIPVEAEDDDTDLILGLCLGIGVPIVLIAIIAMMCCVWRYNRKDYDKDRRRDTPRRNSFDDYRRSRGDYFDKGELYRPPVGMYRY